MALFLGFRAEARKRVPGTGSARGLCADLPAGLCWRLDALLGMAFPLVRRGEFHLCLGAPLLRTGAERLLLLICFLYDLWKVPA